MNALNMITSYQGYLNLFLFLIAIITGYLSLIIARKYRLPEPLVLFAIGVVAKFFITDINSLPMMPLITASLIIILFDAGAHFIPHKFDPYSRIVSEMLIYSIILNSGIIFLIFYTITPVVTIKAILISIFAGSIITATSQFEIIKWFKIKKNRLHHITELEDHLSNPIMLVIALITISIFIISFKTIGEQITLASASITTLSMLFVDIGSGIVLGMIMLYTAIRLLDRKYFRAVSITFAFAAYIIGIMLGGTGFITIIVMSLFYHNISTKTPDMGEFTPLVSNLVYIFIFITMGIIVKINSIIFLTALAIIIPYLIIRLILIRFFFRRDRIFLALDCPKGLAMGSMLLFALAVMPKIKIIQQIGANDFLYSLIIVFIICISLSYVANLATKDIIK